MKRSGPLTSLQAKHGGVPFFRLERRHDGIFLHDNHNNDISLYFLGFSSPPFLSFLLLGHDATPILRIRQFSAICRRRRRRRRRRQLHVPSVSDRRPPPCPAAPRSGVGSPNRLSVPLSRLPDLRISSATATVTDEKSEWAERIPRDMAHAHAFRLVSGPKRLNRQCLCCC